jgi:hypothetical protein
MNRGCEGSRKPVLQSVYPGIRIFLERVPSHAEMLGVRVRSPEQIYSPQFGMCEGFFPCMHGKIRSVVARIDMK